MKTHTTTSMSRRPAAAIIDRSFSLSGLRRDGRQDDRRRLGNFGGRDNERGGDEHGEHRKEERLGEAEG
jgi:hypothetical protein